MCVYLSNTNEIKIEIMTTITTTEWYLILSKEFSKYSFITKEMNENQMSEFYSQIRIELKTKYKIN
jgi:hypothetical protein